MIAVLLMGGLGNQMFQYAAARSLALERKTWVYLDPFFLYEDAKGRWTQRHYELGALNVHYKYERSGRINFLRRVHFSRFWRRMSESKGWPFSFRTFIEKGTGFQPEFFSFPKNTYLKGYFQSEKYFLKHADVIRKELACTDPPAGKNAETLEKIIGCNAVSIHVRRGDYITLPTAAAYHGFPGLEYYAKAIEHMQSNVDGAEFFVFSDEPAWVKQNLPVPGNATFVDWNVGKGHEDLRLMSNCRHHIIANSSFSWWGAWLNPSKEKLVIAPKNWFANPEENDKDIIPAGWLRF